MEQLKNFSIIDLCEKLKLSDDFDAWLEQLGLLHGKRTCSACGGRTTIKAIKDSRYGSWRCTTKNCRKEQGYLCGTFFQGTHLDLKSFSTFIFLGAALRQLWTTTVRNWNFRMTICDWMNFFRDVCAEYFIRNPIQIGGEGTISLLG